MDEPVVPLTPLAEAVAPLLARHHDLIAAARDWSLSAGAPLTADLVALICGGATVGLGIETGPVTWWTRPRVNDLLMRGIFNWCSLNRCFTPDGLAPAVWRFIDFLSSTGRLDPASEPLPALREPLICYGGLGLDGAPRPLGPSPIPCRCYHPYGAALPPVPLGRLLDLPNVE